MSLARADNLLVPQLYCLLLLLSSTNAACGKTTCSSPTTSGAVYFPNLTAGRHQAVILETTVLPPFPVLAQSTVFLIKEPPFSPFVPGALSYRDYTTGMRLAEGLNIKLLARVGYRVKFDSQFATRSESSIGFHRTPDGASVIPREGGNGGWTYMSNSEESDGRGGVFAVQVSMTFKRGFIS